MGSSKCCEARWIEVVSSSFRAGGNTFRISVKAAIGIPKSYPSTLRFNQRVLSLCRELRNQPLIIYIIGPMLKAPLLGSEDLLRRIKDALGPDRNPLLIAIDGADGVGKSSLASWLAWQLGMPTVHLDLYLIRGSRPLKRRTDEVDRLIQTRLNLGRPIIVEGILVLDVLDQISRSPDFLAYVSGEGGKMFSKRLDQYQVRYDPVKRAQFCLNGFNDENV
jgi:hypothetical protein